MCGAGIIPQPSLSRAGPRWRPIRKFEPTKFVSQKPCFIRVHLYSSVANSSFTAPSKSLFLRQSITYAQFFRRSRTPTPHTGLRKQMLDSENLEPEKRNCGRTGPTSPEGRAASSKNSTKHGACSRTLILPHESKEEWEDLLAHWCDIYKPAEDSLYYDFVLRTAEAEWHRRRAQLNFDVFMGSTGGGSTINWQPDQIKKHDLALRYKTTAERAFQREFRLPRAVLQSPPSRTRSEKGRRTKRGRGTVPRPRHRLHRGRPHQPHRLPRPPALRPPALPSQQKPSPLRSTALVGRAFIPAGGLSGGLNRRGYILPRRSPISHRTVL